jgi:hypothetical protein
MYFRLCDAPAGVFQGEFRTAHEITAALCEHDGSLHFTSEAFVLQKISCTGTPPPQLEGMDVLPEPWSSQWALSCTADPRTLQGEVSTTGTGISHGIAKAVKVETPG